MYRRFSSAEYPEHELYPMPALSPTMEEGNLPEWNKAVGDLISPGDVVAMVETDKATLPFEAVEEGYLAKILVPAGSMGVTVGTPIAVVVESEEDIAAFADYTSPSAAKPAAVAEPVAATPAAAPAPSPTATPTTTAATTTTSPPATALPAAGDRVPSSPFARTAARARGISVAAMAGQGTGVRGMVVSADVANFQGVAAPAPATTTPTAAQELSTDYADIPHSNVRKVIAARLTQSKQEIPHYYLSVDVTMDALLKVRSQLNTKLQAQDKAKVSVNDFIIKASAKALLEVQEVNSSWMDTAVRQYNYVDISVAVSTPNGLVTPIVRDADCKGLAAISADVRDLATRARDNKLLPTEYQGGTFTISNLGMFGTKNFCAIINPPQAAILAVGATETRVVPGAEAGEYQAAQVMNVTLSCDHRVVDGAVGAKWLQAFRGAMEDPLTLML